MGEGRCQLNKPQTRPKVRKQAWEYEADHRDFVRQLPCCACNLAPPSEFAHVRSGTDGALARKPSDKWGTPLCTWCHAEQHQIGELSFWERTRRDPLDLAAKLWSLSRKYEGDELIERGHYAVQEWRRR